MMLADELCLWPNCRKKQLYVLPFQGNEGISIHLLCFRCGGITRKTGEREREKWRGGGGSEGEMEWGRERERREEEGEGTRDSSATRMHNGTHSSDEGLQEEFCKQCTLRWTRFSSLQFEPKFTNMPLTSTRKAKQSGHLWSVNKQDKKHITSHGRKKRDWTQNPTWQTFH